MDKQQLFTDVYHFGARFYDPSTALWTQQDRLNQIASLKESNRNSNGSSSAGIGVGDEAGISYKRTWRHG